MEPWGWRAGLGLLDSLPTMDVRTGTLTKRANMRNHFRRLLWIVVPLALILGALIGPVAAEAPDLRAESQKVLGSPDVSLTERFDVAAPPRVCETMYNELLLLGQLWDAYQFAPPYKVSINGKAIHVVDPTGIEGDLYLVDKSFNRRVYYGAGKLNHKLVPHFTGKIAVVLTTEVKGKGTTTQVDVRVRVDNRLMGFLSSAAFPLVKKHAEKRVISNTTDLSVILKDIEEKPVDVAKRLKKQEDAEKFARLFPGAPPEPKGAPAKKGAKGKA